MTLRERVLSASQDPVFRPEGTLLRSNLDPWTAATDTECNAVLADLGLAAIVVAKGGLGAPLTEAELSRRPEATFLSGADGAASASETAGDGCRWGLLLLDEITSAADAETEGKVRRVLEEEFARWTVVMVTHRLEVVTEWCDRVIVLDAGKIVEDGTQGVLLQKEGGWFRELWIGQNSP